MCEPSILIAYLREPNIRDIQNERRILHWRIVVDYHDNSSYERNSCHIDQHDESGKWYVLRDSTNIDNAMHSLPEFKENGSPDGTNKVGYATNDNMDRIFKKSSNHSNCQGVMRLSLKKSHSSTLQMKNLDEINETKPLTSCQELEN
jgi:predicted transport protein